MSQSVVLSPTPVQPKKVFIDHIDITTVLSVSLFISLRDGRKPIVKLILGCLTLSEVFKMTTKNIVEHTLGWLH